MEKSPSHVTTRPDRVAYKVFQLASVDPLDALETLVEQGEAENYWIYQSDTDTKIALDVIGEVVVQNDYVRSIWNGEVLAEERVTDPFAQVGDRIAEMPVTHWRAFGYITFDTAGYYYPYPFRSQGAQIRFVVPKSELVITGGCTTIRAAKDPARLINGVKRVRAHTRARPNAPALDFSDRDAYEKQVADLLVDIGSGELKKAILARCVQLPGCI